MGKSRRGSKEFSREQALVHENKKLKRTISTLRKQLARIDLDRYEHIKNTLENHYLEEEERETTKTVLNRLRAQWKCRSCPDGVLEIVLYTRAGNTQYFRQCNCCSNRTKSQTYTDSVSGLHKKKDE